MSWRHIQSRELNGVVEVTFADGPRPDALTRTVRFEAVETGVLASDGSTSRRDASTRTAAETKFGEALPTSIGLRRTRDGIAVVVGNLADARDEETRP